MDNVKGDSSSSAKNEKPVIVRVKRKASQLPLEALWLEISDRPLKRAFLDFEKLSISDSAAKAEEVKKKKIFVRHVETVGSSRVCSDVLQPYICNESVDGSVSKRKLEDRKHNLKTENKQNKLLLKAKQKQDALSKNARFEQIWRSRKGKKEARDDDGLHDMCRVYDIIRVDVEETSKEPQEQEDEELEDHKLMSSFLPLLRELLPSAAVEVESDILDYVSRREIGTNMENPRMKLHSFPEEEPSFFLGFGPSTSGDDYVYDLYTVKGDTNMEEDVLNPFPLVQVNDEDEFYDGPDESEHDSDDSNAEDNPVNDYPDEEPSEDDDVDDSESITTKDDSEEESTGSESSSKSENLNRQKWSREVDPIYDGDFYCDDDDDDDRDRDRDAYNSDDYDDENDVI